MFPFYHISFLLGTSLKITCEDLWTDDGQRYEHRSTQFAEGVIRGAQQAAGDIGTSFWRATDRLLTAMDQPAPRYSARTKHTAELSASARTVPR
jgi:hypothetical protein